MFWRVCVIPLGHGVSEGCCRKPLLGNWRVVVQGERGAHVNKATSPREAGSAVPPNEAYSTYLVTTPFTTITSILQTNNVLQSDSADIAVVLVVRCVIMVHTKNCNCTIVITSGRNNVIRLNNLIRPPIHLLYVQTNTFYRRWCLEFKTRVPSIPRPSTPPQCRMSKNSKQQNFRPDKLGRNLCPPLS